MQVDSNNVVFAHSLLHLAVVADIDHKTVTAICAFAAHTYGYLGLNSPNNLLQTPLHIASCIGDQSLVQILLDFGADIALADRNIETAIHLAVKYERQSCLKVLLAKCGGKRHVVDALNANGLSALHLCLNCKAESANTMIKMIVQSGADISKTCFIHLLLVNPLFCSYRCEGRTLGSHSSSTSFDNHYE